MCFVDSKATGKVIAWTMTQIFNSQFILLIIFTLNSIADVIDGTEPLYYKASNSTFDWRTRGVISAVENQGGGISAWDEVVRESIESLHAIQSGKLIQLSIDEVCDCCPVYSYQCVVKLGGLCRADAYKNGTGSCQKGSCSIAAKVTGWKTVVPEREDLMVQAIHTVPLMAGIHASLDSFLEYTSGIYEDPRCKTETDHFVQLVGYGSQDGKDYWIAKNSWSPFWGKEGYIYIRRGKNMCGISDSVSYPVNQ